MVCALFYIISAVDPDFVPFIVTAVLPTVISAQWRSIDSHRLTRDEQTWLSTTYVQIYAFLQVRELLTNTRACFFVSVVDYTHKVHTAHAYFHGAELIVLVATTLLFWFLRCSRDPPPNFTSCHCPLTNRESLAPMAYASPHQVSWTRLIRGNPDHAWVAKVPTWPLTLVFVAQFVAIAGAVCEFLFWCFFWCGDDALTLRTLPLLCRPRLGAGLLPSLYLPCEARLPSCRTCGIEP